LDSLEIQESSSFKGKTKAPIWIIPQSATGDSISLISPFFHRRAILTFFAWFLVVVVICSIFDCIQLGVFIPFPHSYTVEGQWEDPRIGQNRDLPVRKRVDLQTAETRSRLKEKKKLILTPRFSDTARPHILKRRALQRSDGSTSWDFDACIPGSDRYRSAAADVRSSPRL